MSIKTSIKTFAQEVKDSVASKNFYKSLIETKLSFSIKYYLKLSVLLITIAMIPVMAVVIPDITYGLKAVTSETAQRIPDELVITVENGQLSKNIEGKVEIASGEENGKNLVVIDTEGTIEKWDEYNTHVLVNSKNVIALAENSATGTVDFEVTQVDTVLPAGSSDKEALMNIIQGYQNKVVRVLPFVFILGLSVYFAGNFFYAGIVAVVLRFVSWVFKVDFSFKQLVQISVHSMTLSMILGISSWFVIYTLHKSNFILEGSNTNIGMNAFMFVHALYLIFILSYLRNDDKLVVKKKD